MERKIYVPAPSAAYKTEINCEEGSNSMEYKNTITVYFFSLLQPIHSPMVNNNAWPPLPGYVM